MFLCSYIMHYVTHVFLTENSDRYRVVTNVVKRSVLMLPVLLALIIGWSAEKAKAQLTYPENVTEVHASGVSDIVFSEDNLLIVDIHLKYIATNEPIEVYQHSGGYLVPLAMLTTVIDFPIAIDPDAQTANGWFIRENRLFSLDVGKREVVVEGVRKQLDARPIFIYNYDIYVDSSLLMEWFPIDLELNFSDLVLKVEPREPIPYFERLEREKKRGRIRALKEKKLFEIIREPYHLFTMPFVDSNIGYNYDNRAENVHSMNYAFTFHGDMGYMNTRTFVSGNSDRMPTSLRLTAARKDYEGKMLGFLGATDIQLGDIDAISTPLVTSSGLGRGIKITNRALQRSDLFDKLTFIGDTQPGWEVEVYRNGSLVDFQTVGENGRYDFQNIEIFYGNNVIRIVSFGPQGQIREKTYNYLIDDAVLKQGQFTYQLSADKKSQTLFEIDEEKTEIRHLLGYRFSGNVEYGITRNITSTFGYARTPLDDDDYHEYATLGMRNSYKGYLADLNLAYDIDTKGVAGEFAIHTRKKGTSYRFEQSIYADFESETERASTQRRKSLSSFKVNGSKAKIFPAGFTYKYGIDFEIFAKKKDITSLTSTLSTTVMGIGFNNDNTYRITRNDGVSSTVWDGNFTMRGRLFDTLLRSTLQYSLQPKSQFRSLNISAQKQITPKLNVRADLRKTLLDSNLTSYTLSINRQMEKAILSGVVTRDTTGATTFGVQLTSSFGREPRTGDILTKGLSFASSGGVSATAYKDNNYNGIFDDGDERLPDIAFRGGNKRFIANGTDPVLVTGLTPYLPSNVTVDIASIEDPFWVPTKEGYSVVSRPGTVTNIDFPIVVTTEIDGTIAFKYKGQDRNVAGIRMELLNAAGEVIDSALTEFDGFYLFERVLPGSYSIRVANEFLQETVPDKVIQQVDVVADGDVTSGIDFNIVIE